MANTYTQLYTHIVFHTKSTGIIMRDEDLERVFQYIGGIIREEGAIPFAVGGVADHIHILTTLPKTVALADFVRAIKAKSSKWLKTVDSYYESFQWQEGYGAFSVSPSGVPLHSTTCLSSIVPTGLGRTENYNDTWII